MCLGICVCCVLVVLCLSLVCVFCFLWCVAYYWLGLCSVPTSVLAGWCCVYLRCVFLCFVVCGWGCSLGVVFWFWAACCVVCFSVCVGVSLIGCACCFGSWSLGVCCVECCWRIWSVLVGGGFRGLGVCCFLFLGFGLVLFFGGLLVFCFLLGGCVPLWLVVCFCWLFGWFLCVGGGWLRLIFLELYYLC